MILAGVGRLIWIVSEIGLLKLHPQIKLNHTRQSALTRHPPEVRIRRLRLGKATGAAIVLDLSVRQTREPSRGAVFLVETCTGSKRWDARECRPIPDVAGVSTSAANPAQA